MNTRLLMLSGAVFAGSLLAVWIGRRKSWLVTVLIAVAIASTFFALFAFNPEYPWLVETGGVLFVGSLLGAWFGRSTKPLLVRFMFALAFAAAVPIALGFVTEDAEPGDRVAVFYAASLRGSLFSGFLTLGGFLLSLQTFIVVKMKEGVYDNDRHRAKVEKERERTSKTVPIFGELDRLRRLLFGAITAALGSAVCQITVGLVPNLYTTTVCLTLAAFAIALLAQSLLLINSNLHDWFAALELDEVDKKTAKENVAKEAAEKAAKEAADAAKEAE